MPLRSQAERPNPAARTWKIGSVCSGYTSPWLALELLRVSHFFEECFACDVCPAARAVLAHNFEQLSGQNIFGDVMKIDGGLLRRACPLLHIFTAGFPCQPFSAAGLHQGTCDGRGRGTVAYKVIELLAQLKPLTFLLENVEGLVVSHWSTFSEIIKLLRQIQHHGQAFYQVTWKVLNSRTHSGLPQNRPRVFIIGIAKHLLHSGVRFEWPPTVPKRPLALTLRRGRGRARELPEGQSALWNYYRMLLKIKHANGGRRDYIGDLQTSSSRRVNVMLDCCPCITKTRASAGGYYSFLRRRFLDLDDMFALQEVPRSRLQMPPTVSARQMGGMIGNAMHVHMVARLLCRLLKVLQFPKPVCDPVGHVLPA